MKINYTITRNVYFGYYSICMHTKLVEKDIFLWTHIYYVFCGLISETFFNNKQYSFKNTNMYIHVAHILW